MNAKPLVTAFAALAAPLTANTPGPVRALACIVSETGLLEAEVSNTSDVGQSCRLRCDYVIREATLTHAFEATIPARYRGRAGQFDTSSGRPGRYAGHVDACRDVR